MNRALVLLFSATLFWSPTSGARTMTIYETPREAPQFELPATQGGVLRLSDFKGRYLLVNFWAVWCSPCRREMPSMQRAYESLRGQRFDMLAIHVGPSVDGAKKYAGQLGLTFPIAVDADMALSRWQVQGLPTTFLLDPAGRIVAEAVGERAWDSPAMLDEIRRLTDLP